MNQFGDDAIPVEVPNVTTRAYLEFEEICPDCVAVAKHFLIKGLLAFGKSMQDLRGQIDMFPGDKFISRDEFIQK